MYRLVKLDSGFVSRPDMERVEIKMGFVRLSADEEEMINRDCVKVRSLAVTGLSCGDLFDLIKEV